MVRKAMLLAAAIGLAIPLGACSTGANELAGTVSSSVAPGVATTAPIDATASPSAAASYKVGDRIKLGDEEYFAISRVDLAFPGTTLFKPAADKKWVAALVEIEGINPTGASYNPFYFKVRDDQGFEYNFSAFGKEPTLQSSNDLKPGQKVKGWVTFEVPAKFGKLTLVYAPGFFNEPVEVALN